MTEWPAFPYFTVISYETGTTVWVIAWHVRSIRAVREASMDAEDITRIEYANGDSIDVQQAITEVLRDFRSSLDPVTDWLKRSSES